MFDRAKPRSRGKKPKEFAVIGLGRFGGALARRLETMGHTVLDVDIDIARVRDIADEITSAVALDATSEDALQEVDIASFATVIVASCNDFETGALITAYLKALGIPRVICMAQTRRHRDILLRIGADQVIVSDEDSGLRLAEVLAAPDLLERAALTAELSLVEFKAPDGLVGKSIASLKSYEATVILIQRPDCVLPSPAPETTVEAGDTLFAVGQREKLLEAATLP